MYLYNWKIECYIILGWGGGNKLGMYFRDLMAVTFLFPPV